MAALENEAAEARARAKSAEEQLSARLPALQSQLSDALSGRDAALNEARQVQARLMIGEQSLAQVSKQLEDERAQTLRLKERLQKQDETHLGTCREIQAAMELMRSRAVESESVAAKRRAEIVRLKSQLSDAKTHSEAKIGELLREIASAREAAIAAQHREMQVRNSLSWALARTIKNDLSKPSRWLALPMDAVRVCRVHSRNRVASSNRAAVAEDAKQQNISASAISTVGRDAGKGSPVSPDMAAVAVPPSHVQQTNTIPKKKSRHVHTMLHAAGIAARDTPEAAVAYARHNAIPVERPAIHLLEANVCLASDEQWLLHTNEYLKQFDLAPVALLHSNESRFMRLTAATPRQLADGPLISVIMPAYNTERTLEFAAQSILSQTWRRLELIIVNDASSDSTQEIAERLKQLDSRVHVLCNPCNVGPYVSKNAALHIAKGDYIACHDADDWAHPERFERHLRMMSDCQPRTPATLFGMLRIDESGRYTRFAKVGTNSFDGALATAYVSCIFETQFLRTVLGHWDDVRFAADSEIIGRAEAALGHALPRLRCLGMFCLDTPTGLTNHGQNGCNYSQGLSPTRFEYREAFRCWHAEQVKSNSAFIDFPQMSRKFPCPLELSNNPKDIRRLVDYYHIESKP